MYEVGQHGLQPPPVLLLEVDLHRVVFQVDRVEKLALSKHLHVVPIVYRVVVCLKSITFELCFVQESYRARLLFESSHSYNNHVTSTS